MSGIPTLILSVAKVNDPRRAGDVATTKLIDIRCKLVTNPSWFEGIALMQQLSSGSGPRQEYPSLSVWLEIQQQRAISPCSLTTSSSSSSSVSSASMFIHRVMSTIPSQDAIRVNVPLQEEEEPVPSRRHDAFDASSKRRVFRSAPELVYGSSRATAAVQACRRRDQRPVTNLVGHRVCPLPEKWKLQSTEGPAVIALVCVVASVPTHSTFAPRKRDTHSANYDSDNLLPCVTVPLQFRVVDGSGDSCGDEVFREQAEDSGGGYCDVMVAYLKVNTTDVERVGGLSRSPSLSAFHVSKATERRFTVTGPLDLHRQASTVTRPFLDGDHRDQLQHKFHTLVFAARGDEKLCPYRAASLRVPIILAGGMYDAKTQWFVSALADAMLLTHQHRSQKQKHHASSPSATAAPLSPSTSSALAHFLSPSDIIDVLMLSCRRPEDMLSKRFAHMPCIAATEKATHLGATIGGANAARLGIAPTAFVVEWFDFSLLTTISREGWHRVLLPLMRRYVSYPPFEAAMSAGQSMKYLSFADLRDHLIWVAHALRPSSNDDEAFSSFLERMIPTWSVSSLFASPTTPVVGSPAIQKGPSFSARSPSLRQNRKSIVHMGEQDGELASMSPQSSFQGFDSSLLAGSNRASPRAAGGAGDAASCRSWGSGCGAVMLDDAEWVRSLPVWLQCLHQPSGRASVLKRCLPSLALSHRQGLKRNDRDAAGVWMLMEEFKATPARFIWALMPAVQVALALDTQASKPAPPLITAEKVAERHSRLLKNHVAAMAAARSLQTYHKYMHRWMVFCRQRREFARKRALLTHALQRKTEARVLGPYFMMWRQFVIRSHRKSSTFLGARLSPPSSSLLYVPSLGPSPFSADYFAATGGPETSRRSSRAPSARSFSRDDERIS